MFWLDTTVNEIRKKLSAKIEKDTTLIIRDEKTASGRVHVGSLRGVCIHGGISEGLSETGVKNTFLYEINDFDPMDGLPVYLDQKKYLSYMGKPLYTIPSPDGKAKNYAEYFGREFIDVIEELGFQAEYYRASEVYKAGKFNEVIRLALENADHIREIYQRVSGSKKTKGWFPLQIVCEQCGKIGTTEVTAFDGQNVTYICKKDLVKWAQGCEHEGSISPFNGNAKLSWKVDWAAKFVVMNVDIEGAGKDHYTKGGSREVANTVCREVFNHEPPFDIPYEFFHVSGKKMSSSKGRGSSSREIADLLPPEMVRFLLMGKAPKKIIDFVPDGDTISILFDHYDALAEKFFSTEESDDAKRIFPFIHTPHQRKNLQKFFSLPFSQVAFLLQMPHMNLQEEAAKVKGSELSEEEKEHLDRRAHYAKVWLKTYAPEDYKYVLQKNAVPTGAQSLSTEAKEAVKQILAYIESHEQLNGQEVHTELHRIKKETGISPREFFAAFYQAFLGKDSGPKAGWFLSVLNRDFLIQRLKTITQ